MKWSKVQWRKFEVSWKSATCGEGKGIKAGWEVECGLGLGEMCVMSTV